MKFFKKKINGTENSRNHDIILKTFLFTEFIENAKFM